MADVPMPEDSDLPSDVVAKLHSLPRISIYRLLAIVPRSVTPWADLVGAIYNCELPDRLREIGICRQARTARARYELFQHRQIARNNGVTQDELDTIHREPVVTSLDDEANLVCQVADELETSATDTGCSLRDARAATGDGAHLDVEHVCGGGALHERDARFHRGRQPPCRRRKPERRVGREPRTDSLA
jgi:alkylhydroperoxidase family enzyme